MIQYGALQQQVMLALLSQRCQYKKGLMIKDAKDPSVNKSWIKIIQL